MQNKFWSTIPPLIVGSLLICGAGREAGGEVGVGISINIGPPPISVAAPPAVVMVPQSQVYFVPNVSFDVFYHNGSWWSPRGEVWYRSRAYNGPWVIVDRRSVPAPVLRVPHDYRTIYVKEKHIPYGQWKKEYRHHEGGEEGKHGHDEKHGKGHDKGHGEGHGKGH